MPYSNSSFNCDINLSQYNSKIINLPLYHDGEIKELSKAPFFCIYLKENSLKTCNMSNIKLKNFNELGAILSNYIKFMLNLKIYYVAEAEVYRI